MATEYLFSNNAATTLVQSVSTTATVITVAYIMNYAETRIAWIDAQWGYSG